MVKIIWTVIYIAAFGVSTVIFLLYGRKKGLRGGITVAISSAAAFIASYFLSPLLASALLETKPVVQLVENIVDVASEHKLDNAPFINILSDSLQRILEIPSAIVLYILFFIVAFVLMKTVMRFIKSESSEQQSSSKAIGAVLGAMSPIVVAVLTLFVSKINMFSEAESIDIILPLVTKPANEIVAQVCDDTDLYTKIMFETTLTGADENQRLGLINSGIKGIVSNTEDDLLIECFDDFEGYSSRSEFEADIKSAAELYRTFEDIDLFADGDFAQKLFSVPDKIKLAEKLYQLSFKEHLIRYVISYVVHGLTGKDNFMYQTNGQLPGTYEDFAAFVTTVEKFENGELSQLELLVEIKDSPFLPTELYAELIFMNWGN